MSSKIIQQYLDIKSHYQDMILFFRIGDFYEVFFDDALVAASELNLLLTKKTKSSVPMCGIPVHSLDSNIEKLSLAGYKIAIAEQMHPASEGPSNNSILERRVTQVITPGIPLFNSVLNNSKNTYLLSLAKFDNIVAISYVDIFSGSAYITEIDKSYLEEYICSVSPQEILCDPDNIPTEWISSLTASKVCITNIKLNTPNDATKVIKHYYKDSSVPPLSNNQALAFAICIEYIAKNHVLYKLNHPKIIGPQNYMRIDNASRKNLEIMDTIDKNGQSLFDCLNYTQTKHGARTLREYLSMPLLDISQILKRQNIISILIRHQSTKSIINILSNIPDINRILNKIELRKSSKEDLLKLSYALESYSKINNILNKAENYMSDILEYLPPLTDICTDIHEIITKSISKDDNQIINLSFHAKIEELVMELERLNERIEIFKNKYKSKYQVNSIKISHHNNSLLFVEVSYQDAEKLPNTHFTHISNTSRTARFTTNDLKDLEIMILKTKTDFTNLSKDVYDKICHIILNKKHFIQIIAEHIGILDALCSLATFAMQYNCVAPIVDTSENIIIKGCAHPQVKSFCAKTNISYVVNDCVINKNTTYIITGPNMGGKSTFLRQVAIATILAQIGSFIPCESAQIGAVDQIFCRIGASDNISQGTSTFMNEMLEASHILKHSSPKSLIIMDELGRGTSHTDGIAIITAVIEYICNDIGARCLFATHYSELQKIRTNNVKFMFFDSIIDDNNNLIFLYKIRSGLCTKSYGIYTAILAGLPNKIIQRAKDLLLNYTSTQNK